MSRIEARAAVPVAAPTSTPSPVPAEPPSPEQVQDEVAQTQSLQPRQRVQSSRRRPLRVGTQVPQATRPGEFVLVSRSFLPQDTIGGFHGDDRGFSTDANVTARARVGILFESTEQGVRAREAGGRCDESSTIAPTLSREIGSALMPGTGYGASATATPVVSAHARTHGAMASVQLDYAASNPVVPAPMVDVHAGYAVAEVDGNLRITGRVTGDAFPALEAFVRDHAGNAVFIGARALTSEDGLENMNGDNHHEMASFDVTILRDPDTQEITGVRSGGREYGVDAWNARFENGPAIKPGN